MTAREAEGAVFVNGDKKGAEVDFVADHKKKRTPWGRPLSRKRGAGLN